MKKKFMCMLMAAAMTLSMAACGSKGDDANTDDNAGGASDGVQTNTEGTTGRQARRGARRLRDQRERQQDQV